MKVTRGVRADVLVAVMAVTAVGAITVMAGDRTASDSAQVPTVQAVAREASTQGAPRAVGTLTYDNDVPFSRRGTDGGTVGNLFTVGVLDPHNVDTVSFRLAGNYAGSVVMTVWDQNPGSFVVLNRQVVTGIPQQTVTGLTFVAALASPVVAHTGPFVGGIRNTDYDPCAGNVALNSTCDGVALTAGGPDPGFGFNAIRVPFNSGSFVPTINTVAGAGTAITGVNAIFRVTGDNLPVELRGLDVE